MLPYKCIKLAIRRSKLFAKKSNVPFKEHRGKPVQALEAPPFLCKSFRRLCGNARDSNVDGTVLHRCL